MKMNNNLTNDLARHITTQHKIDILCIGTPKIVGDAYGPFVGTLLKNYLDDFAYDVKIVGSLSDPVIKTNYSEKVKLIREDAYVIAIDAMVSNEKYMQLEVREVSLHPGAAMSKRASSKIKPVGDLSVVFYSGRNIKHLMQCPMTHMRVAAASTANALRDILTTVPVENNKLQYPSGCQSD